MPGRIGFGVEGGSFGSTGGTGEWTEIADETLTVAAASFTISSIPATAKALKLLIFSEESGSGSNVGLRFNGDSGANYDYQYYTCSTSTLSSGTGFTSVAWLFMGANGDGFNPQEFNIFNNLAGEQKGATGISARGSTDMRICSSIWNNTADLINSILVFQDGANDFNIGSRVILLAKTE